MCGYLLGISRNAKFRERHNQKMRPTHLYPILIHPNVSYLPPPHPSMVISVISMVISVISVGISVISVIPVTLPSYLQVRKVPLSVYPDVFKIGRLHCLCTQISLREIPSRLDNSIICLKVLCRTCFSSCSSAANMQVYSLL